MGGVSFFHSLAFALYPPAQDNRIQIKCETCSRIASNIRQKTDALKGAIRIHIHHRQIRKRR